MRFLRCGCSFLSVLSLLPILLLFLGGLVVFNDPHVLPGVAGDFAASARGTVASFVLGNELNASNLSVRSVDFDPANGGVVTLTLETKATKAPTLASLAPALKAVGGHLAGPLSLTASPTAKVVIIVKRTSDDATLVTLHATVSDLRAYADGKLTTTVFLKRVTSTP